jgi:hypothetical protein
MTQSHNRALHRAIMVRPIGFSDFNTIHQLLVDQGCIMTLMLHQRQLLVHSTGICFNVIMHLINYRRG